MENQKKKSHLLVALMLLFSIILLLGNSCKKTALLTNGGKLVFSKDTLNFDTVFSSLGSFTLQVKIFNPQAQKVNVSSIRLENGAASQFHINVDGFAGIEVKNIEIAPNDSIYVFATVNVDPTAANSPFIITDQLIATLNGNDFKLPLNAYGQNAHYIKDSVLNTQTWLTDKPYVIIKHVEIDTNQTLTIPAGCRVYMHADARFLVLGSLHIDGTKTDSVLFQGDRLDRNYFGYEGYPGEWGGFYFDSYSKDNYMKYARIKNCGSATKIILNSGTYTFIAAAVQVNADSVHGATPQLLLDHTIIQNSIGYGILSFGGTITANNCLIFNTGAQALAVFQGGNCNFNYCDFLNMGSNKLAHTDNPTVSLLDYYEYTSGMFNYGAFNITMNNCLVWGTLDNEFYANTKTGAISGIYLNYTGIKSKIVTPPFVLNNNVQLTAPQFLDPYNGNFRLNFSSTNYKNTGTPLAGILDDLDGQVRSTTHPSVGCYE